MNLLRLAEFIDSAPYRDKAVRMLTTFRDRLNKIPVAVPEMVCALMFLLSTPKQVGYVMITYFIKNIFHCNEIDAEMRPMVDLGSRCTVIMFVLRVENRFALHTE